MYPFVNIDGTLTRGMASVAGAEMIDLNLEDLRFDVCHSI
jgi:hypothetical protein